MNPINNDDYEFQIYMTNNETQIGKVILGMLYLVCYTWHVLLWQVINTWNIYDQHAKNIFSHIEIRRCRNAKTKPSANSLCFWPTSSFNGLIIFENIDNVHEFMNDDRVFQFSRWCFDFGKNIFVQHNYNGLAMIYLDFEMKCNKIKYNKIKYNKMQCIDAFKCASSSCCYAFLHKHKHNKSQPDYHPHCV